MEYLTNMYKPTFKCADDEEQFNEKVAAIALEELKELKRKQFFANFQKRVEHYKPLHKEIIIEDYDYMMDIDSAVQDYKIETINQ